MHQLVVARYAEALDWLADVPPAFEVIVYNKGTAIPSGAVGAYAASITARPNQGRESETYLAHVLGLRQAGGSQDDDFVVFAQGDPFEHSPDFLELLQAAHRWADVQPLSWRWKAKRDIPPARVLARETGGFIDGLRVRPELFSLQSWTPLGFHDAGAFWLQETYRRVHRLPNGANIAAHFLAMCGLPTLAAQADANLLGRFAYGAVFAARRSRLMTVPETALSNLRRASLGHEVYGYVLERLWLHLFGMGFILPALLTDEHDMASALPDGPEFVPSEPSTPGQKTMRRLVRRVRGIVRAK